MHPHPPTRRSCASLRLQWPRRIAYGDFAIGYVLQPRSIRSANRSQSPSCCSHSAPVRPVRLQYRWVMSSDSERSRRSTAPTSTAPCPTRQATALLTASGHRLPDCSAAMRDRSSVPTQQRPRGPDSTPGRHSVVSGRISMLRGRPGESRKSTPALITRINGSPSCQPVLAASSTAASMLSKFVRSIRSITGPIRRPIGPPLGTYR